jgi:hypothetical protein
MNFRNSKYNLPFACANKIPQAGLGVSPIDFGVSRMALTVGFWNANINEVIGGFCVGFCMKI